tara:strand:+ start:507 stop:680 length:174 start_codon:yes stop_codon:yes gene_type:complete
MKVKTLDITKPERMVRLLDWMQRERGVVILADPSPFIPKSEMTEKLEGFFELLEDRR